jgi:hypothetical protein
MPKLKLKRTPAEERERELRRARRASRKAAQTPFTRNLQQPKPDDYSDYLFDVSQMDYAEDGDEVDYGPQPASYGPEPGPSSASADYDHILRNLEDQRFREKMADAMEDEVFESGLAGRIDATEARMNDFAHVPQRWRRGGMRYTERPDVMDDVGAADPTMMDDEEYAEWVRAGMWKCVTILYFLSHSGRLLLFVTYLNCFVFAPTICTIKSKH